MSAYRVINNFILKLVCSVTENYSVKVHLVFSVEEWLLQFTLTVKKCLHYFMTQQKA